MSESGSSEDRNQLRCLKVDQVEENYRVDHEISPETGSAGIIEDQNQPKRKKLNPAEENYQLLLRAAQMERWVFEAPIHMKLTREDIDTMFLTMDQLKEKDLWNDEDSDSDSEVEELEDEGTCHESYSRKPLQLKWEDLKVFTHNFDEENFIGPTQFGKLYRGKIQNGLHDRDVTVKIVDEHSRELPGIYDVDALVYDEVKFLTHPSVKYHPNLVKVIGYCCEKQWGVVYDLSPLDSLYNMILRDEFTWVQRIKVALGLARLLEFLHGKEDPYVVFNLDPAHIMLDQDYNPILFEFGLLHGGFIGELSFSKRQIFMAPGYVDICLIRSGISPGPWCDIYVYGMILLELIAKKTFNKEMIDIYSPVIDKWAKKEYKANCTLAHDSFEKDSDFHASDSLLVTELGMSCIEYYPKDRPSMKQVVERLECLQVVAGMY